MTKKQNSGGGQRGARLPKGPPPAEGRQAWDWHSRAGRERLDAAVLRVLAGGVASWMPRGDIATALKIGNSENAMRAVSASLTRLRDTGWSERDGEGTKALHRATATGREAAKMGCGR